MLLRKLVHGLHAVLFAKTSFELAQSFVRMLRGLVVDDELIEIL